MDAGTDGGRRGSRSAVDGFERFARRIQHEILSPEEEVALGRRVEAGRMADQMLAELIERTDVPDELFREFRRQSCDGREAADEFALHNMRLVMSIAGKYRRRCGPALEYEDLLSEGYLGLAHAIEKWDHRRGLKFSTYAIWWIRQSITRALDDKARAIRVPVHRVDEMRALAKAEAELAGRKGLPSAARVAAKLEWKVSEVNALRSQRSDIVSLDALLANRRASVGSLVSDQGRSPEEQIIDLDTVRVVRLVLENHLGQREREVIQRRFGIGGREVETLEEIGASLGVTRERIRQIESKSLAKLHRLAKNTGLLVLIDLMPEQCAATNEAADGGPDEHRIPA